MKNTSALVGLSRGKTLLLLAAAVFFSCLPAQATLLFSGVDLGAAGRTSWWSAFALSGGIDASGASSFTGNIGSAGAGGVDLSGSAKVTGNAYVSTSGVLRKSGSAAITGALNQNSIYEGGLNHVVSSANAAALQANQLANTTGNAVALGWGSMTTINQNSSLSLSDTSGSHVALHLTDFVLTGGATFTLTGTAATTYVINVSNDFSLSGGAKVLLAGGLLPENVLFNITGTGSEVSLSSVSQFNGMLLATKRTVSLSGASSVKGTIIASNISISGSSKVTLPPFVSP